MQSGFLWIFVLILIAVVVLVALILPVWYLVRKKNAGRQVGGGVNGAAYCTNCGRPLRVGDQFCPNCGAPIRQTGNPAPAQPQQAPVPQAQPIQQDQQPAQSAWQPVNPQPGAPGQAGSGFQPFPPRKKGSAGKLAAIIVAAVVGAGLLAALLLLAVLPRLRGESGIQHAPAWTPAPAASSRQPEKTPAPAATERYENDTVKFALEYPGAFQLTEPHDNNVLITRGEPGDFQVSVEYAWHTVGNSAIYDAEDFARQIAADPQVLYDWLGTEDVELAGPDQVEIAGTTGTEYGLRLNMNGQPHAGSLVVFDGDSAFGCYTFLSLYNEAASDGAEYEEQVKALRDSVEITGPYTQEGYQLYENEEGGWNYLLREGSVSGEIQEKEDEMTLYPVERVFSECSVWLSKSFFTPEHYTPEEALEGNCGYYFNYHDNAAYTSQISQVQYGRYPCWEVDLEYDGSMKLAQFLLDVDGVYWDLSMKASEEYYETAKTVAADLIMSLRFDEKAAAPRATATPRPTAAPTATPRVSAYGDQEWYLTLDGLQVVNIRMPAAWTEDRVAVTDVSNQGKVIAGLRFSSKANQEYGGHLVTIAVCEPGALADLPSGETVFDLVLRDGSHYDVVWMGPTDVQYDYNNDGRSQEYQDLYAQVSTLLDGLSFYQGDW